MVGRGLFITFEGIDGSGKTTQGRLLSDRLKAEGRQVIMTREPGGMEKQGSEVRRVLMEGEGLWSPLAEALLYSAERSVHLEKKIIPALEADACVICDRFSDSSLAYQGYGQGGSLETIEQLNRLVVGENEPDLTFVFDLDPVKAHARLSERGAKSRYDRESEAFHKRVRAGFLEIAKRNEGRCVIINASGDKEETAEAVWVAVLKILERRKHGKT